MVICGCQLNGQVTWRRSQFELPLFVYVPFYTHFALLPPAAAKRFNVPRKGPFKIAADDIFFRENKLDIFYANVQS